MISLDSLGVPCFRIRFQSPSDLCDLQLHPNPLGDISDDLYTALSCDLRKRQNDRSVQIVA